jgi:hypothetical protein
MAVLAPFTCTFPASPLSCLTALTKALPPEALSELPLPRHPPDGLTGSADPSSRSPRPQHPQRLALGPKHSREELELLMSEELGELG